MPRSGEPAPDFVAETDRGGTVRLSDLRGKKVILYFYPRDSTPGCTMEACGFRDRADEFAAKNCVILGVSADSVKSHERFSSRHNLPFRLISDSDHAISAAYGAWREKTFFRQRYMATVRCTIVIDEEGLIKAVYDKVRVFGHVSEVLASV